MKKKSDSIKSILKSLSPIKYKYSQKFKELDKTFKYMSLENLLKTLDYHPKLHDEYTPSPEFLNNKKKFDINFQNSFNYIKEFSDLNNLPLVLSNRNCLKNGTFNPDYEYNPINNKEEQKQILLQKEKRKKERLKDRLERLKKWRESDSNVDPGKYHPNYDFIKRKIRNVYIREPIVKINKKSENQNEKDKNKIEYHSEEKKNNENNHNINNNTKINFKDNLKEVIKDEKNDNHNNNNSVNLNDSHSKNDNSSNANNNSSKISLIKNIKKKAMQNVKYRNNSYLDKNSSTLPEYSKTIGNNKSFYIEDMSLFNNLKVNSVKNKLTKNFSLPKIGMSPRKIKIKSIKYKTYYNRSSSLGSLNRNPVLFKKMLGRNDTLFSNQNLNLISYFPNYKSTMPHIPATIFKYKENEQNYKKFITGKIIRGYNYTSEKYFVIDYKNQNQNKKINMNKEREIIKEILKNAND